MRKRMSFWIHAEDAKRERKGRREAKQRTQRRFINYLPADVYCSLILYC